MEGQFDAADIERMRQILRAHDEMGKSQEFDLNKPPTKPYVFQKFPMAIYHHATGETALVKTEKELQTMLEAGWSEKPFPQQTTEPEAPQVTPGENAEIALLDAEARKSQSKGKR